MITTVYALTKHPILNTNPFTILSNTSQQGQETVMILEQPGLTTYYSDCIYGIYLALKTE